MMRHLWNKTRIPATALAILLAATTITWSLTVSDGMEAGWQLGQPDFTTGFDGADPYYGAATPPTAATMSFPEGITYDAARKTLFVADGGNNRVLVYLNVAPGVGFNGRAADRVLGQTSLTASGPNATNGGAGCTTAVNACGLARPIGLAFDDAANRLWVADSLNHRVLGWDLPASHGSIVNGEAADHAIGQPTFTGNAVNAACGTGVVSTTNACGLSFSMGVATGAGRLMVADNDNERVVFFNTDDGITDGEAAVGVIGKPDLTSSGIQLTAAGVGLLCDVKYDAARSRLYVADCYNNRIMAWTGFNPASFTNGAAASAVIGQTGFTSGGANAQNAGAGCSTAVNACGLNGPYGMHFDAARNRLYVVDSNNSRVLAYDDATLTNGEAAVGVLGRPNLTTGFDPFAAGTSVSRTELRAPEHAFYVATEDRLYVTDDFNHRVVIYGLHTDDAPLTIGGGTGTTSGGTTTIVSTGGNAFSVTFPSGTVPLAPNASVIVTVGDGGGGNHPSIAIDATLPAGQTKTVTIPWYNSDVCINDVAGATITTQGSCNAPKVKVAKNRIDVIGECYVWEGSDTICRTNATTVTISGLEHSALYYVQDSDDDGVDDDDDVCAGTDLGGPVPAISLRPNHMGDGETIDGCNASQILACKGGNTGGEQKYGISQGLQNVFANRLGWAKDVSPADGTPDCFQ